MLKKNISFIILVIGIVLSFSTIQAQEKVNPSELILTLDKCIELTLNNHNSRDVSKLAIRAAEAQVKQAKSGSFPQIDFMAGYLLFDEDPNFIYPELKVEIPPMNLGTFILSPGAIIVPPQNVKIADKQTIAASIELMFPLFTGGKISSYINQAEAALEISRSDSSSNDQQIIFETKKLYYTILFASKLEEIASEAYERFNTTLQFTEATYKNGSGKVTKSDYLKNKTITEAIKAIWIQISGERKNALAALAHAMGLEWNAHVMISEKEFPKVQKTEDLEKLILQAIGQNPMFAKFENGLKVYESKIDLAKSDLYPSIALFGNYKRLFNSYDSGFMTKENKNVWTIGIGLQLNIFNGFRTSGMIDEAKAKYDLLKAQKELLRKGISLKVQYLYNKLQTAIEKEAASKDAMQAAIDDRELVEKAYFVDIMELKDLIQAQLTESIMKAQYETVCYECITLENELQLVLANNYYK